MFKLFDNLLYTGKPDWLGLPKATLVTVGRIWRPTDQNTLPPNAAYLQQLAGEIAAQAGANPIVLDVEHLSVDTNPAHRTILIDIAIEFARQSPHRNVGYYGLTPKRDYWRAIGNLAGIPYSQWESENDNRIEIGRNCQIHFPSLYTFYNDHATWKVYAERNIAEARRYHGRKPIYAYLWPQYHDSNAALRGQYLPADLWYDQLEHVAKYADGAVLWGGWQETWNENAPWWIATKCFMKRQGVS